MPILIQLNPALVGVLLLIIMAAAAAKKGSEK
jgi:hypothetical protein